MITRSEARADALKLECPFCQAKPGSRCRQLTSHLAGQMWSDKPARDAHVQRMMLVPEWAARENERKHADVAPVGSSASRLRSAGDGGPVGHRVRRAVRSRCGGNGVRLAGFPGRLARDVRGILCSPEVAMSDV